VGCPHVIFKEEGTKKMEPIEAVIVIVPESNTGTVIEKLGKRK
jgi:predicted membrane GTPase involved in stress response